MNTPARVVIKNIRVTPPQVWNDGRDRVSVSVMVFTPNDGARIERVEADLSCWRPDCKVVMAFHQDEGLKHTREGLYSCSFEVPLLADPGTTDIPIVASDSKGSTGTTEARVVIAYRRPAYADGILHPASQTLLDHLSSAASVGGNRIEALENGNDAFEKRMALIREARRQINLQTYTLVAEGRCGRLVEAILEKAAQGVEVNLLVNLGSQLAVAPLTPLRIGLEKVGRELQGFVKEVDEILEARQSLWGALKNMQEIFQRPEQTARGLRVVLVDDQAILGTDRNTGERDRRSQKWLKRLASDQKKLDRVGSRSPSEWLLQAIGSDRISNLPLLAYAVHEKILVVDGKQAIVGGRNLEDRYFSHWIDKDLYLEGPVVRDIQRGFLRSWEEFSRNSKRDFPATPCDEKIEPQGNVTARFVQSRPWLGEYSTLGNIVTAIQMARERICMSSQYIVLPEGLLLEALLEAAARGVEIHVLMNSYATGQELGFSGGYLISLNHIQTLLDAGIRIHEVRGSEEEGMPKRYLHAKEFLIDGQWAAIGSFNLSIRSSYIESENLVNVQDPGFVGEQERAFWERVSRDSQEITRKTLVEQKQRFGTKLNLARHLELFY